MVKQDDDSINIHTSIIESTILTTSLFKCVKQICQLNLVVIVDAVWW